MFQFLHKHKKPFILHNVKCGGQVHCALLLILPMFNPFPPTFSMIFEAESSVPREPNLITLNYLPAVSTTATKMLQTGTTACLVATIRIILLQFRNRLSGCGDCRYYWNVKFVSLNMHLHWKK